MLYSVARTRDLSRTPRFWALDFRDFSAIWGQKSGDFRDLARKGRDSVIWECLRDFTEKCSGNTAPSTTGWRDHMGGTGRLSSLFKIFENELAILRQHFTISKIF